VAFKNTQEITQDLINEEIKKKSKEKPRNLAQEEDTPLPSSDA